MSLYVVNMFFVTKYDIRKPDIFQETFTDEHETVKAMMQFATRHALIWQSFCRYDDPDWDCYEKCKAKYNQWLIDLQSNKKLTLDYIPDELFYECDDEDELYDVSLEIIDEDDLPNFKQLESYIYALYDKFNIIENGILKKDQELPPFDNKINELCYIVLLMHEKLNKINESYSL